jgi:hypothetical protein
MSILIDNVTYDVEDEDLMEVEYYEILTIAELIKDNPTFIAFSREEIVNELYDFFKDTNKSDAIADLFFNENKPNILNYVFIADATKKDNNCDDQDINSFVNDVTALSKLQYKVGQKEKNKYYFALTYDDKSTSIRVKPHMKTTIELRNNNLQLNAFYPVFDTDDTNIPILAAYYRQPAVSSDDYICEKIVNENKNTLLNYVETESYSDVDKMLKVIKPKMKTIMDTYLADVIKDTENFELDFGHLDAVLKRFNSSLDEIDTEDFAMLKTHMQEQIDNIKVHKISHTHFKIKPSTVSNDKIEFYNKVQAKHIVENLQFSEKIKEDYQLLINALNEEKMNINSPPLLYNNINDIVDGVLNNDISIEEVIDNLAANRNVLVIDHCVKTLKNISENQVDDIADMLQHLTDKFKGLKNTLDIFKFNFLDFYADIKEVKEGNDYSEYEGIPDIYKNDGNYDGMANDDIYDDIDDDVQIENYNIELYKKYWLSIKYRDALGFTEMLQILLPILHNVKESSKLGINFELLCDELFKKYAGLATKYHIMQELLQADNIKFTDDYIRDIVKISPVIALNTAVSATMVTSDIASYVQRCNRIFVENLHNMVYTSIAWISLRIQDDIIKKNLIFDENEIMIAYVDKWSMDGLPVRESRQGVLVYLGAILEDVMAESTFMPVTNIVKNCSKIIDTDYIDVLENLKAKLKGIDKRQNKGTETYLSLLDTFKNKQKDRLLNDYVNALLYMPSHKFKKIHKILLGCCLQPIGKNFVSDGDIITTEKKGLIAAKKLYAKRRETNKNRYAMYVPYMPKDKEEEVDRTFVSIQQFIKPPVASTLDIWLTNMVDLSPLLPNHLVDIFLREGTMSAVARTKQYIQCFCKTAGYKSQDFEDIFVNSDHKYRNIFNIVCTIYKMYPADTSEELMLLNNAIKSIQTMMQHIDGLSDVADQYNIQDIKRIKNMVVARSLCLPFNPDIARNNILYASVEVSNAFTNTLIKQVYTTVNKYLVSTRMPTVEENISFINTIREQNKIKTLSVMNTKTPEERNLMMALKKIGLQYQDDNDQDDEKEQYNINDDYANYDKDDEIVLKDQEEYGDDEEIDDYGFIYS